mmetsp:Transcript_43783/g.98912  ORF Transcript_43783/g.98912 Transcript_43783/m.98912 type:complete len:281 (-) Transcript_43783:4-846(-)
MVWRVHCPEDRVGMGGRDANGVSPRRGADGKLRRSGFDHPAPERSLLILASMVEHVDRSLSDCLVRLAHGSQLDPFVSSEDLRPSLLQNDRPEVGAVVVADKEEVPRVRVNWHHVVDSHEGFLAIQKPSRSIDRVAGLPQLPAHKHPLDEPPVGVRDRGQGGQEVAGAQLSLCHIAEFRTAGTEDVPVPRLPLLILSCPHSLDGALVLQLYRAQLAPASATPCTAPRFAPASPAHVHRRGRGDLGEALLGAPDQRSEQNSGGCDEARPHARHRNGFDTGP